MAKIIITSAQYLEHERYYRRMMELHPEQYSVIIDSEQYIEDGIEPPIYCKAKDEYVTAEEAAGIIGVSKGTVHKYIKKGYLRGIKTSKWLVAKDDAENFKKPQQKQRKTNKEAREAAIERDGRKCVLCGSTDNLEVHHIKHRADGGTDDLDNLTTLCARCHAKQHEGEPIHNLMVSRFFNK